MSWFAIYSTPAKQVSNEIKAKGSTPPPMMTIGAWIRAKKEKGYTGTLAQFVREKESERGAKATARVESPCKGNTRADCQGPDCRWVTYKKEHKSGKEGHCSSVAKKKTSDDYDTQALQRVQYRDEVSPERQAKLDELQRLRALKAARTAATRARSQSPVTKELRKLRQQLGQQSPSRQVAQMRQQPAQAAASSRRSSVNQGADSEL